MSSQLFWHNIQNGIHMLSLELKAADYQPDVIISVSRGGLIPATLLAYKLNVRTLVNYAIQSYSDDTNSREDFIVDQSPTNSLHFIEKFKDKKILVVDDLSDTGTTIEYIYHDLTKNYNFQNVKTATVCIKDDTRFVPDFYIQKYPSDTWLTFPWEVDGWA